MHAYTTLIDAATLVSQLGRDDVAIFDCRFELGDQGWGEAEYAREHLPGAQPQAGSSRYSSDTSSALSAPSDSAPPRTTHRRGEQSLPVARDRWFATDKLPQMAHGEWEKGVIGRVLA